MAAVRTPRLVRRAVVCVLLTIGVGLVGCTSGEAPDAPAVTAPAAAPTTPPDGGDTLAEIRARGFLRVGVNDSLAGFGYVRGDGSFGGFDVDFGHALTISATNAALKRDSASSRPKYSGESRRPLS